MNRVTIKNTVDKLNQNLLELFAKPAKFISMELNDSGWTVYVEVIEEDEYMTMHARNQLIAIYQVDTDMDGEIRSFKRIHMRERGDLVESECKDLANESQ